MAVPMATVVCLPIALRLRSVGDRVAGDIVGLLFPLLCHLGIGNTCVLRESRESYPLRSIAADGFDRIWCKS